MRYAPNVSCVGTRARDGTRFYPLGLLGNVTGLRWSDTYPGGSESLECTLQMHSSERHPAIDPGRIVEVWRGASPVWTGRLSEPQAGDSGWSITAQGVGTFGDRFRDIWTTWNANDGINQAITRGLEWRNPGIPSGVYLAEQQDSASITVTQFLTLVCKPGGYGWRIGRRGTLTVAPLPVVPTRILMASGPQARSLAGYITALYGRYQATADNADTGAVATFGLASAVNTSSSAKHGREEEFWDITAAGVLSPSAAAGYVSTALSTYVAASWAGPIPFRYGQYLTMTGVPVDIRCEVAGEVVQMMLTDGPYGGEVAVAPPVRWIAGKIEVEDDTGGGQLTPYQAVPNDLPTLLDAMATRLPRPAVTS